MHKLFSTNFWQCFSFKSIWNRANDKRWSIIIIISIDCCANIFIWRNDCNGDNDSFARIILLIPVRHPFSLRFTAFMKFIVEFFVAVAAVVDFFRFTWSTTHGLCFPFIMFGAHFSRCSPKWWPKWKKHKYQHDDKN